jgi:hypothetical protein
VSGCGFRWDRALVVFSGRADLWWLRALRPGFRHCFLVLGWPGGWVTVEALSHRTEVAVLPAAAGFDLAGWYRGLGLVVVEADLAATPRRPAPWRPYSCVEEAKRILGIRAATVFTPWQLYKFLRDEGKSP